mgnify:CR=1 FL=1
MSKRRKTGWTLFAILAVALALSGFADNTSDEYAEEAFKRALVTFAVARGLNGVISVAQGTEIAVEPGGVGVNFTVGQILDPINDLIEQFSSVMLVATSSLGLQNILLNMTGWWGVTAVVTLAALFMVIATWWPGGVKVAVSSLAMKVFLITVFLRFALPLLVIGTHIVFSAFLESDHDAATAVLEATSSEIETLNQDDAAPVPNPESTSLMDRFGDMWDSSVGQMNIAGRIDNLKTSVSSASEQIINLIVIFVLQTIILPLVFLWLLVEGLKGIASRAARLQS